MKKLIIAILFSLTILGAFGCTRTRPMLTPSFEVMSANQSVVAKSVRVALLRRGWSITSDKPGRVEAVYRRGGDTSATIAVTFRGKRVSIEHVSSSNLLLGQDPSGAQVIHRSYNNWVTYLERDIQTEIARNS